MLPPLPLGEGQGVRAFGVGFLATALTLALSQGRGDWTTSGVDGRAVMARDAGDVFGRLQPPLDLQRGDPGGDQFRQPVVGGQIVRAEQDTACRPSASPSGRPSQISS